MGKPQGVNFLLQVIEKNEFRQDSFIIVVGGGTDYPIVRAWYDKYKPKNSVLISYLPKTEYDEIVSLCDVGLVFLDRRFTVPTLHLEYYHTWSIKCLSCLLLMLLLM